MYIHISTYTFHPAQDSLVWLRLTSREQLMSPECSMNKFRVYISTYTCFVLYIYIYIG